MMLRAREDVLIGPMAPVPACAAQENWLHDQETNQRIGWGSGLAGIKAAQRWLLDHKDDPGMMGVYLKERPVGWINVIPDGDGSVRVMVYLAAEYRNRGVGPTALFRTIQKLFKQGDVQRIEVELAPWDVSGRKFIKGIGFKEEGARRARIRMDGKWHRSFPFSLTPELWSRAKKRWNNVERSHGRAGRSEPGRHGRGISPGVCSGSSRGSAQ